jgi:plastocyanin
LIRTLPRRRAVQLAGLATLTLILVACSAGASTTPLPSGGQPPADCARVDAGVITLSANDLKFSAPCMVANADEAFTIHFTNDENQPHDVAIYPDSSKASELAKSDIITGPDQSTDLEVGALAAGQYYFDCQVHTEMNGTLYVVAAGAG